MAVRSLLPTVVTAVLVGVMGNLANAEPEGEHGMPGTALGKHTERPVHGQREAKTFAPSVVDLLRHPLTSQLVTLNPNGTPQVTVMWFKYEDGALLFTTTTDRVKFRNHQRDPRAVFSVVDPTNMYRWVIVHGILSVDERDPAAFYRALAEHYLVGEGLSAWQQRAVMDKRTVLRLTPIMIRTMGFPPD
jgi:PPOX class probable F420-dependent enzyme